MITSTGEALFWENGTAVEDKLKVLSRTYPLAVAGSTLSYEFNSHRAKFTMIFRTLESVSSPVSNAESDPTAFTTEIYYNRELYYPQGMNIEISDEPMFTYKCPADDDNRGVVELVQTTGGKRDVTVTITPCHLSNKHLCSCPFKGDNEN